MWISSIMVENAFLSESLRAIKDRDEALVVSVITYSTLEQVMYNILNIVLSPAK